jgi:hypothetical protein
MKTAMPHLDAPGPYDALVELVKFDESHPDWEKYAEHIQDRGWLVEAFLNYKAWVEQKFGTTNYISLMTEHFYPIIPIWDIKNPEAKVPVRYWYQDRDEEVPESEFLKQMRGPTVAWVHENCRLKTGEKGE